MSWLVAFNIFNRQNDIVRQISYALYRLTEPVLGPIRRVMPDLGGLDISPIVAIHHHLFHPLSRPLLRPAPAVTARLPGATATGGLLVALRVTPRSSRDEVTGLHNGVRRDDVARSQSSGATRQGQGQ